MNKISILRHDKRKQTISLEFKGDVIFNNTKGINDSRIAMNINWKLSVYSNAQNITAGVSCESKFNMLHGPGEVEIKLNIYNKETEELVFEENVTKKFTTRQENVTIYTKDIKDFIIPKNEYKLDCEITVIKLMGTVQPKPFNILEKKGFEDGIIVFDDKKEMAINKMFLSFYSSYFYNRFYQEENNNSKIEKIAAKDIIKELEIPKYFFSDVSSDEFKKMIDILPPVNSEINDTNYSNLLKLSNRYKIEYIKNLCEVYLKQRIRSDKTNKQHNADYTKYIKLIDEYFLWNLLDAFLWDLTYSTLRSYIKKDDFDELSEKTKARIAESFYYTS